jgi:hypothetical protein
VKSTVWTFYFGIILFGIYMYWIKPTCRDGFVSVVGIGASWYCASGYKP